MDVPQAALPVLFLASFISLVLGAFAAVLIVRAKRAGADATRQIEFEAERSKFKADLEHLQNSLIAQNDLLTSKDSEIRGLADKLFVINSEKVALEENLRNEKINSAEKLALLNDAQKSMSEAFAVLSRQALDQNNQSFVNQATQVFKEFQSLAISDLNQRQERISEIVLPVQKSLENVDSHIAQLEKERLNTFATIGEQINQMTNSQQKLSETTSHLVSVLRNTKTRGQWGEIQLRRVVELAGMSQHCDFCEQYSVTGADGMQRPDMIVNLPAKRIIVVDAKAPMSAFLEAYDATDDDSRKHHFRRHAKSLRSHVGQLSKKAYFENFDPSPEFVLMFLPNESVFSVALEYDPDLIEFGAANNVIIATPLTLIALLKAAAYGWRQEAVAADVRQVAILGRKLYDRIGKMANDVARLGRSLDKSVRNYNTMIGSMEGRVLTSARKFKDLPAIGSMLDVANLESIETTSRSLQAPEMTFSQPDQNGDDPSSEMSSV